LGNDALIPEAGKQDSARPVILAFVRYYIPGDKSGGPVRSIVNLVNLFCHEFDFRIVAFDRDWKDEVPYEGVAVNAWNKVGNAWVYYISQDKCTLPFIAKLLSDTHHDVLYLNSFFDPIFAQRPLWARKLGLAPKRPLIIAPRGEFSPGAFCLKLWKKSPYTWLATRLGLYSQVIWHASSELEASDIRNHLASNRKHKVVIAVVVASDVASDLAVEDSAPDSASDCEHNHALRVVFISRITPKKNLDFALRVLAKVQVPVEFDIYGPIGEDDYWDYCKTLIGKLPPNIAAKYLGILAHPEVSNVFQSHDLFLFPTRGENFGHVIMESLAAGTPVLIADTTPWQDLDDAGVGWELSLDNESEFVAKIHAAADLSAAARGEWRRRVLAYACERVANPEVTAANRRLFVRAIQTEQRQPEWP